MKSSPPFFSGVSQVQAEGRRLLAKQKTFGTQPALALSLAVFTSVPKSPNSIWGAFRPLDAGFGEGVGWKGFPSIVFGHTKPILRNATQTPENRGFDEKKSRFLPTIFGEDLMLLRFVLSQPTKR